MLGRLRAGRRRCSSIARWRLAEHVAGSRQQARCAQDHGKGDFSLHDSLHVVVATLSNRGAKRRRTIGVT
jgi:hypothetical protein